MCCVVIAAGNDYVMKVNAVGLIDRMLKSQEDKSVPVLWPHICNMSFELVSCM